MSGSKGKQGRKPKPSTILGRLRDRAPSPVAAPAAVPKPPSHLSAAAKREWRRIGVLLLDRGLLTELDASALALYCDAYARLAEANRFLDGPVGRCPNCDPRRRKRPDAPSCNGVQHTAYPYGKLVRGALRGTVPSLYRREANDAAQQMRQVLGEFGMTPASRSRIPQEPPAALRMAQAGEWANAPEHVEDPRPALRVVEGGKK